MLGESIYQHEASILVKALKELAEAYKIRSNKLKDPKRKERSMGCADGLEHAGRLLQEFSDDLKSTRKFVESIKTEAKIVAEAED